MRWTLLVLLVGVPAADVALDVALVRTFGFLPVFVYLVVAFVLGVAVVRYAGPVTLVRATARVRRGEMPGRELVDGIMMLVGGGYLLFPGPMSDVLAIFLVTPFLRRLPRWWIARSSLPRRATTASPTRPPEQGGPVDVDDYRVE